MPWWKWSAIFLFLIQAMLPFAFVGVLRIPLDPMLVGAAVAIYMAEIERGALSNQLQPGNGKLLVRWVSVRSSGFAW